VGKFGNTRFCLISQCFWAALAVATEPCADQSAGAGVPKCTQPQTFVLKKKIELEDSAVAQRKPVVENFTSAPDPETNSNPSISGGSSRYLTEADVGVMGQNEEEDESPEYVHLFTFSKTPREPLPPGSCNQTFNAGSDKPETFNIYIGGRQGTAKFKWNTFAAKDRMKIFHQQRLIHDTGCVGEENSRPFQVAPGTLWLRVEVTPNCENTVGTAWEFKLICP
jgi:hypothetical protein